MHHTDKPRQSRDEQSAAPGKQSAEKDRSKSADAGAAPEQSEQAAPGEPDDADDEDIDEPADPREKRQDPPVPGQPKRIRVNRKH
jgi:hypothetical protein